MNTISDIIRQSFDIARASVMFAERRKYRVYLYKTTWSGIRVGEGTSTKTTTEIGHKLNSVIYPPHVEEVQCGILLGGGTESIKISVKHLLKSYITSSGTGGYNSSDLFLQATNTPTEYQYAVKNLDTNGFEICQLQAINDHELDFIDLELFKINDA